MKPGKSRDPVNRGTVNRGFTVFGSRKSIKAHRFISGGHERKLTFSGKNKKFINLLSN